MKSETLATQELLAYQEIEVLLDIPVLKENTERKVYWESMACQVIQEKMELTVTMEKMDGRAYPLISVINYTGVANKDCRD